MLHLQNGSGSSSAGSLGLSLPSRVLVCLCLWAALIDDTGGQAFWNKPSIPPEAAPSPASPTLGLPFPQHSLQGREAALW